MVTIDKRKGAFKPNSNEMKPIASTAKVFILPLNIILLLFTIYLDFVNYKGRLFNVSLTFSCS